MDKLVYFLMKRRLSNSIDPEPPLFPWETEVTDYAEDSIESAASDADLPPDGHDRTELPPPDGPSA